MEGPRPTEAELDAKATAAWQKLRAAFSNNTELRELCGLMDAKNAESDAKLERRLAERDMTMDEFLTAVSDQGFGDFYYRKESNPTGNQVEDTIRRLRKEAGFKD